MGKSTKVMSLILCLSAAAFHTLSATDYFNEDQEMKVMTREFKKPSYTPPSLKEGLVLLKSPNLSDIMRGVSSIRQISEESPGAELLPEIANQAERLSKSEDLYIQAAGCFLKLSLFETGFASSADNQIGERTRKTLTPLIDSPSLYLRFLAHNILAQTQPSLEEAIAFWQSSRKKFPPTCVSKIDLAIASLDIYHPEGQVEFRPQQVRLLESVLKSAETNSKQRAKAMFKLAGVFHAEVNDEYYRPKEAAAFYEQLLHDKDPIDKIEIFERFAYLLRTGPESIKNEAKALKFYHKILHHKKSVTVSVFANALFDVILLLAYSDDPEIKNQLLAYQMAQEAVADPSLPELVSGNLQGIIASLLRYGPEGVKDHHQAAKLFKEQLQNCAEVEYPQLLDSLANLYHHGDQGVKDLAQATDCYMKLLEFKEFKISALNQLIGIYSYGEVPYKNLPKALAESKKLIELYQDQPEQQIIALNNLLELYANPEIFDWVAVQAIAEGINGHSLVTNVMKLNVQLQLSKMYGAYPENVPLAERHQVHYALAHNPLVNPLDRSDAFNRLIAVYQLQGDKLNEIVAAYNECLAGDVGENRSTWLIGYILFLQNPDNAVVANPERLQQLIVERDAPLLELQ